MVRFMFGQTFRWASYRRDALTGKPDYVPFFKISKNFSCLPLIWGNLYIMRGDNRASWEK